MRGIGLLCVLCSASASCFSSSGGSGDDVSSCDTAILCMEIDSANNSHAGIVAFEDDCDDNGANFISASCLGGDAVCRNIAMVAGEDQISVIVDFHYKVGYQAATGNDPGSDCTNLGGDFEPGVNEECPNPDFPVYCGEFEGDCWSPGVDCSFPIYECGGSRWRCLTGTDYAACCDGTFYTCGSEFPNFCPDDNMCYQTPNPSCTGSCEFTAADCDGQ